jgi:hypothetical protein
MMILKEWRESPKSAKRPDLDKAWTDRLADAKALLGAKRSAWSIASGLYALEIRLKFLVCKNLDLSYLHGAAFTHDLSALLILAGLSQRINDPSLSGVKINWDEILIVAEQLEDLRYRPDSNWPFSQAESFLGWLDHPSTGVLTWLSTL